MATASEKGTVIRVFSIPAGKRLYEFRRGVARCATISSLSFSADAMFLSVSSNTQTVHIFKLSQVQDQVNFLKFINQTKYPLPNQSASQ